MKVVTWPTIGSRFKILKEFYNLGLEIEMCYTQVGSETNVG